MDHPALLPWFGAGPLMPDCRDWGAKAEDCVGVVGWGRACEVLWLVGDGVFELFSVGTGALLEAGGAVGAGPVILAEGASASESGSDASLALSSASLSCESGPDD